MRSLPAAAALCLAFAGCTSDRLAPAPPACPAGSPTRDYDALSYALTGQLDWATRTLAASEVITLALTPGASAVVELDSTVEVSAVRAAAGALSYCTEKGKLRVDVGPLAAGGPITFTVDYRVRGATSLLFADSGATTPERDPVRSRIAFTDSEPRRGHEWLVQKDDPADPALFAVTLTVPSDEEVVANGERLSDQPVAGGHRVSYAIDVPIATYLMAFAAGQLEQAGVTSASGVPLTVWYRRGLALDPTLTLDAVSGALATFEALLGPYPFSRYSVVLQPLGSWGMENATMTIESERFGQTRGADSIHRHELAHQWFGDLVTMRRYDDVWVKEGMATLLAAESDRARLDAEGRGRLLGRQFAYNPGDAIVDTLLGGLDKYTSGPYGRAAALMTQIRARVGEAAFWARLRGFLADHARGSATGEEFVRAFAPDLTEPEIAQVLAILPQKAVPTLSASILAGTGDPQARLLLDDPSHLLLAPYGVTVVDGAGVATAHALTPGVPLEVAIPAGGYLAPDEGDVHVDYPLAEALLGGLGGALQPAGGPAAAAFASRSASHQERALLHGGLPPLEPGQFQAYYQSLDSDDATVEALAAACVRVPSLAAADRAAWIAALAPIVHAPRVELPDLRMLQCGPELGATFLAELQALAAAARVDQLERLVYLLWFDYDAAGREAIAQVAASAPSLLLRLSASNRLYFQPAPARAPAPLAAGPSPAGVEPPEGKRLRPRAGR